MKLFDFNHIEETNKLLWYRRAMLWIAGACVFTSISMVSGLALGLAYGFHAPELIILVACCIFSLTTIIPSLFCFIWIAEIEKFLTLRQVDFDLPIEKRIREWALKMMLWAILVVLGPMLIRKLTG